MKCYCTLVRSNFIIGGKHKFDRGVIAVKDDVRKSRRLFLISGGSVDVKRKYERSE